MSAERKPGARPSADSDVERFIELLRDLGRRNSLRDPITATLGAKFTAPQLHAILWLGADGPLTMGEVAQRVGASEKTMTGIVDRLVREDLIRRVRDGSDRRVVRVELTRKGRAAWSKLDREVRTKLRGFLSLLGGADRAALFRILLNVNHKLNALLP